MLNYQRVPFTKRANQRPSIHGIHGIQQQPQKDRIDGKAGPWWQVGLESITVSYG